MREIPIKYLEVKDQIKLLESRGMTVDCDNGFKILKVHNYSHIIHKFGKLYVENYNKDKTVCKYKKDTTLNHLYNLYLLNNDTSLILLKYIIRFEHKLKTILAKKLSKEDLIYNFNNDKNNSLNDKDKTILKRSLKSASNKIKNNKINAPHLIKNKVPIWKLVDELNYAPLLKLIIYEDIINAEFINLLSLNIDKNLAKKQLESIQLWRNQFAHGNEIMTSIGKDDKAPKYKLSSLIQLLKKNFPEFSNDINSRINNIDAKIGINIEVVFEKLKISDHFKSKKIWNIS